jgi:hypothetical protein
VTVVNIKVQVPGNGTTATAEGVLRWEPSGRRIGTDGALILPAPVAVPLVGGSASVNLDPSTDAWAWRVTEFFEGQFPKSRYFAVPDGGPFNYTDLVEVDPATIDIALSVSPDPDNPGFYLIGA